MVRSLLKHPVLFILLILTTYLIALWGFSVPLTGDQKVYLSIALEMYEKKEWIIPSLFGEPNFLKPPFQYWATILGWKVFGFSLFGALIPSVIALVCSSFLVFKIGKKINLESPSVAAVLFAATLGTMTYGSTAQMEIWIVLFFLSSWLAVLNAKLILAFVLVGVMAWIKGPLYPVLWCLCLLIWDFKIIKSGKFWLALIAGTTIGLGWYLLAATTHQQEILNQFLFAENFSKLHTQQGSVTGLWMEFLFSLFPWGPILLIGFFQKNTREKWNLNRKFYLSYFLVPALFFTFFPYRVNSYLYILVPVVSMMASQIDLNSYKKTKMTVAGIYLLLFLFLGFVAQKLVSGEWIGLELLLSLMVTSFLFLAGFLRADWSNVAVASLLLVNLIRVAAIQIGEKDIAGLRVATESNKSEIAFYIDSRDIWHEFGLISSALGTVVNRIYDADEIDSFLAHGGLLILQPEQQPVFQSKVSCVDWQRLKRRSRFPVEKFFKDGLSFGDPEITRSYRICTASH